MEIPDPQRVRFRLKEPWPDFMTYYGDVKRSAGLTLKPTPIVSTHWLVFVDQWDLKSPWADRRVRLAANHAMDRQAVNEALMLGFSRITWSIIPQSFDFYWQPPA